jgi:hypothetical protein
MQKNLTLRVCRRDQVTSSEFLLGRKGIPSKTHAVGGGAVVGASWGQTGGCGREEGDGREEEAVVPLTVLRELLPVVWDLVGSVLCLLFAWLSK